jgi:hypothetical protein
MKRKPKSQYKIWKTAFDKAWKVWSIFIRQSFADNRGYCTCYTCEAVKHWKEMQAGHYHHGALDFDKRNIHPQCIRCNKWLSGNLGIYAEKLTKELGLKGMKKLRRDSEKIGKPTLKELEKIITKYGGQNNTKVRD